MKTKLHKTDTYSANRTLESVIWVTAIFIVFLLFSYVDANSNPIKFTEEAYIDDIPFNTEEVIGNIIAETEIAKFYFEEEEYIDDIPFDTECISANCKYQQAISVDFPLEEETYIDDIIIDTAYITAQYKYDKAIQVEFSFEEEKFITDIIE